uniref:Uncharacterized protein n=1 Tax=Branchiostoma floridae TaxID=7739 RepID=C3Z234_BRAFL|eukprot:XP_002597539.1 hypothetical protein BRAFLDRAFT_78910 [Branchiostoma floridae]
MGRSSVVFVSVVGETTAVLPFDAVVTAEIFDGEGFVIAAPAKIKVASTSAVSFGALIVGLDEGAAEDVSVIDETTALCEGVVDGGVVRIAATVFDEATVLFSSVVLLDAGALSEDEVGTEAIAVDRTTAVVLVSVAFVTKVVVVAAAPAVEEAIEMLVSFIALCATEVDGDKVVLVDEEMTVVVASASALTAVINGGTVFATVATVEEVTMGFVSVLLSCAELEGTTAPDLEETIVVLASALVLRCSLFGDEIVSAAVEETTAVLEFFVLPGTEVVTDDNVRATLVNVAKVPAVLLGSVVALETGFVNEGVVFTAAPAVEEPTVVPAFAVLFNEGVVVGDVVRATAPAVEGTTVVLVSRPLEGAPVVDRTTVVFLPAVVVRTVLTFGDEIVSAAVEETTAVLEFFVLPGTEVVTDDNVRATLVNVAKVPAVLLGSVVALETGFVNEGVVFTAAPAVEETTVVPAFAVLFNEGVVVGDVVRTTSPAVEGTTVKLASEVPLTSGGIVAEGAPVVDQTTVVFLPAVVVRTVLTFGDGIVSAAVEETTAVLEFFVLPGTEVVTDDNVRATLVHVAKVPAVLLGSVWHVETGFVNEGVVFTAAPAVEETTVVPAFAVLFNEGVVVGDVVRTTAPAVKGTTVVLASEVPLTSGGIVDEGAPAVDQTTVVFLSAVVLREWIVDCSAVAVPVPTFDETNVVLGPTVLLDA